MSGGIGIKGIGTIPIVRKGVSFGMPPWDFDPLLVSMTPGMAKRATSVFAAAPIVQGKRDGTGTPDTVTKSRGTLIAGNYFYSNFDSNQGSICFRFIPEWNGNDGILHYLIAWTSTGYIRKTVANNLELTVGGNTVSVSAAAWTAGTIYNLCFRWDSKNTLDGTNYGCISINDVHTFGITASWTPLVASSSIYIGSDINGVNPANGILEGKTLYRRVLYDGTYGVNMGNGDEVNLIAAGVDPTTVTGSWDVCFCLPTNATVGALVTGTGEAWSHPHSSNLLTRGFLSDRYYGGSQWGVKLNGTTSKIDCGSGATLDDLCAGGAIMQVEGWFLCNSTGNPTIISKGVFNTNGWQILVQSTQLQLFIKTAGGIIAPLYTGNFQDGKWHHFVAHYNDTTKIGRVAVDGLWGVDSAAGAGAYISDAADNLIIGWGSGLSYFGGSLGWINIHNDAHYTPGTNFLPPRAAPAPDVEEWLLNEGTGVTATAQVTAPANNGTITAGTWEPQWYDEGSPVRLRSVVGSANYRAVITDAASIQNLQDNAFTVDGWFRAPLDAVVNQYLSYKGNYLNSGWYWNIANGGLMDCKVFAAGGTNGRAVVNQYIIDNMWHYLKLTYDDAGDRMPHIYIDNLECTYALQTAAVGAIISDIGINGYIGQTSQGIKGAHGWIRWSNVVRGAGMIPRSNPPDPADANTILQYNADEGYGAVLTDLSGEGNNGAMAGTYSWNNSPAMESDSPGARNYAWGYVFGIDAPNEGFKQIISGSSVGADYVLRGLAYSEDGLGIPGLVVYDETNSKEITHIYGTTGSTEFKPDLLMCSFELPYIGRPTGTVANCVNFSVKMVNVNGTGSVVGFQQVELLNNLVDNPSLDSGAAANPWIPNGFTNYDMDAGDSEIYATGHSANNCIVFHTGTAVEGIQDVITAASGKFYDMGGFGKGDGVNALAISPSGGHALFQYSTVDRGLVTTPLNSWKFAKAVWRSLTATPTIFYYGGSGAIGDRYLDDLYAILLDDVSLTVTPASAANSVESGGIRVDGWDIAPQPIPAGRLFPSSGWVRFRYLPRHSGANALKFGNATPYLVDYYGDVNNYFYVYWSAASTMTLAFKSAGGALQTGNWATAGAILAGGNYLLEVRYDLNNMYLYVDNVLRITVTSPIAFTTVPVFCYPATANTVVAGQHEDAVFLAP
jgi:hypothetical protein